MRRAALVALVATLVAIPARYARPSPRPASRGSTILLGGSGPLSGPEVSYAGTMIGAKAYFDYVNANGGVFGRKIEYRYLDDAYDPSRTVQNVRKLVQQDNVFAIFNLTGTEQNLAVRPFLNALKVPQLFGGTGVRSMGREHGSTRGRWATCRASSRRVGSTAATSSRRGRTRRSPSSTRRATTAATSSPA